MLTFHLIRKEAAFGAVEFGENPGRGPASITSADPWDIISLYISLGSAQHLSLLSILFY